MKRLGGLIVWVGEVVECGLAWGSEEGAGGEAGGGCNGDTGKAVGVGGGIDRDGWV